MNKRVFYIVVSVMVVALIILVTVLTVLNSRKQETVSDLYPQPTNSLKDSETTNNNETVNPEETSNPEKSDSEIAAEGFYKWYITTPNPLGSGQYMNNEYLSTEFKETIQGFVNRGDYLDSDPILTCVGIQPPQNIKIQPAVYDESRLRASVIISENIAGAQPLYEFLLSNINQKWVVDDVRCVR